MQCGRSLKPGRMPAQEAECEQMRLKARLVSTTNEISDDPFQPAGLEISHDVEHSTPNHGTAPPALSIPYLSRWPLTCVTTKNRRHHH